MRYRPWLHVLGKPKKQGRRSASELIVLSPVWRFSSEKKPRRSVYDESHVTRARLVYARVVDLIQNSVADREPDPTTRTKGGAHAGFGARRPPGQPAWPTGGAGRGGQLPMATARGCAGAAWIRSPASRLPPSEQKYR